MFQTHETVAGVSEPQPKQFVYTLKSGTTKKFVVRWPTDEEWCAFQRSVKLVKPLANRLQEISNNAPERCLELLEKITLEPLPPCDGYEANEVIGKLMLNQCVNREPDSVGFRLTFKVAGGKEVTHLMRMPSFADEDRYNKSAAKRTPNGRNEEWRSFLEPGGELFDKLIVKSDGYGCPVPIIHKDGAASELLRAMRDANDDPDPES